MVEEILYPAMEDYQLDIMIGEGPAARSIKIELPPFTLVGATTRAGLLTSPLRDRFGIVQRLEFYSTEDLTGIVKRACEIFLLPSTMPVLPRSPGVPAAHRVLPIACCGVFVIMPRSVVMAVSMAPSPAPHWICWRWIPVVWMATTVVCC